MLGIHEQKIVSRPGQQLVNAWIGEIDPCSQTYLAHVQLLA